MTELRQNKKSKKRNAGDVVSIPLPDGLHAYARVLPDATFAFYDSRTSEDLPVSEVISRPILFFLAVMDHAIKAGRWPIVGHLPLEEGLNPPPRFIQNSLDKKSFSIYENGQIRPATRSQCRGLERAAVWEPEHVEERLLDHYAGRRNKWINSLDEEFLGRPS
jgi:Immunity protein 26